MKLKNFYKPTPVFWRKVGDTILIGSAAMTTAIMNAPISDHYKAWTVTALSLVGVFGKIITNFFKEEENENQDN